MYIAFKWLLSLSVLMWLATCGINYYFEYYYKHLHKDSKDFAGFIYKSTSPSHPKLDINLDKIVYSFSMQHFAFLCGILSVLVFHKKYELINFLTKNAKKIRNISISNLSSGKKQFLNLSSKDFGVTITKAFSGFLEIVSDYLKRIKAANIKFLKSEVNLNDKSTTILLNKICQMKDERRSLGKLLLSTLQENKNIKTQYQLEIIARNRLTRHVEDTLKLNENRSKFLNFQQLYKMSHHENICLKARLNKLMLEKEKAEKKFMCLASAIYKSKDNELKVFCSRLIVSKNNLLNDDVHSEIQKFLAKQKSSKLPMIKETDDWNKPNHKITEVSEENRIVPVISSGPKLRGLPGEYIWTIKDKYGMIEKLYEYETKFDDGDSIQRIREYSVYFDQDCILDSANALMAAKNQIAKKRFLTSSKAFNYFLQNSNGNIVSSPRSRAILCG